MGCLQSLEDGDYHVVFTGETFEQLTTINVEL